MFQVLPDAGEVTEATPSVAAHVKAWLARIKTGEDKWCDDFERMRENMRFASGIQWQGQKDIVHEDRYTANVTLQMIRHKVANLYARNPEIEVKRRKRMDFAIWDETMESLQEAFQASMQGLMSGMPNMEAMATMSDHMRGRAMQAMVDRICKTIEIVYDYQVDCSKPEFKEQMKQLVTRVVTCGVGYCRLYFIRDGESPLSTVDTRHTVEDRARVARVIANKLLDGDIEEDDAQVETLKSLSLSIGVSSQYGDEYELSERIEFDFPQPTSIIPDPRCRSLKEFVAARWIAQRFDLTLDEINEVFNLSLEASEIKSGNDPENALPLPKDATSELDKQRRHCVYEVLDSITKTCFFVMKGHDDYLKPPYPLDPCVAGFWPTFALTFNDIESSDDSSTSIFPPSDVDLIKHSQKEWNRTRDALRAQRNANAPKYPVRKGMLTDADKEKLRECQPNEVIELEGIPSDQKPSDFIVPLQVARIDPAVYDTAPLEQDMMLAGGAQQANIGPAQPDVTATVGTIAEQSRVTVSSSNVDDLDGFLSRIAQAGCEMALRSFSPQTVQRIAGVGASWPTQDLADYLNMIIISIKAASSGRPNQALDVANRERVVPLLLSAGANPIPVIEDLVRALDPNIDVSRYYPLPEQMLAGPTSGQQPASGQPQPPRGGKPQQPLQKTSPVASPVPLAAG